MLIVACSALWGRRETREKCERENDRGRETECERERERARERERESQSSALLPLWYCIVNTWSSHCTEPQVADDREKVQAAAALQRLRAKAEEERRRKEAEDAEEADRKGKERPIDGYIWNNIGFERRRRWQKQR